MKGPTKIISKDIARDGGTVRLQTDAGVYYIDRSIGTKTRDFVYIFVDSTDAMIFVSESISKSVHELHNQYEKSKF
jgi:hypothetical protein